MKRLRRRMVCVAAALIVSALVGLGAARAQVALDTGNVSSVATSGFFGTGVGPAYDISFRQASLREVLQFLAWISKLNIIMPQGLDGTVDVSFRGVRIEDALNAIIRSNGLEYAVEGSVVRIAKAEQFKDFGEDLKTETFRLRFAPAKELAPKVQTLLSTRGSVIADDRTNSVTVRELPANIDKVRRFIDDVDIKDAQVLIEAKILEATRRFTQELGIQWGLNRGADGSSLRVAGITAVGLSDTGRPLNVNLPTAGTPTSGLFIGSLFKGTNLDVQLLAAERRGDIYVISDPSIVTSNGKSANIRSGATLLIQGTGSVNIGTSAGTTASTGASGLEEKKTGVELTVTPQITIHDYVKMDIQATTSTPDYTRQVQGIPTILDNTATTTVLVKDGETTVIGGLSRYSDQFDKSRVPYLSQIPVMGNLFKSRRKEAENAELMVFIKPSIIRVEGQEPAQLRIREVEQRREQMYMQPLEQTKKPKETQETEQAQQRSGTGKGNKYAR